MKTILQHIKPLLLTAVISTLIASSMSAQEEVLEFYREGTADKLIPISLSGFTGEVAQAIRFDLEVAGCKITSADQARFNITGSNDGSVQGRVVERVNKNTALAKAYSGGSTRVQAHTFSDDAIFAMTNKKGIARTKIAFTLKKGDTSEIVMADYDGHNQIQLTQDGSIVAAPTWAPGGHVIYYTSYMKNNPDIYSQDLRTGARKAVARFSGLNSSAAISPDGQHIAMILSKDGSPDVYVAKVDGSNLRRLTSTREDESSPCWSPDGQKICFASRATAVPRLYTISVNGGQPTRIQTAGVNSATEPDWSPDGKTITFTTTTGGFNVCVVPATGGQVDILAPGMDSVWASNSRTIIFNRKNGGKSVLSLLDVPSKQVKDIPQVSGSASQPSWAR